MMKSIKPEEFFKLIAVNSGISDLEIVRNVFYGTIRTISRELRDKQVINLPDWGKFVLRIHKARKRHDYQTKTWISLPATPVVKFVPDYKVKKYFQEMGRE